MLRACMIGVLALLVLSCFVVAEEVFPSDILSPYDEGFHGAARSRREISRAMTVDWNNRSYEEYQLERPVTDAVELSYTLNRFEDTTRSQAENSLSIHRVRYLLGSIVRIDDPYYTLSILEPDKPGGCQMDYYSTVRSTVSATSHKRRCKVATNAGYFSVTNGKCLGNIVSDGRIVQTSQDMNANFGIRQDGTLVVGYIPQEEVVDGAFRQLVSGVIWLVRNGTNYVKESMRLESSSNQNTGKMSTFVNVLSARTAIGHDSSGRVVFANVEGQTHRRGANLYEFADLLIAHGLVNAINLDGGGSSTLVQNGVLVNYPSDHCAGNSAYRCERQVSTVLCFHDVECIEPSCNNHGVCDRGECVCEPPWIGSDCGLLNCSLESCSDHGNCTGGLCECESGWGGQQCQEACSSGHYGPGCTSKCWCYGKSMCDPVTGDCRCPLGYTGFGCWKDCEEGFFGQDCLSRCPTHNCSNNGLCSNVDGTCLCFTNWTGLQCNETLEPFDQELSMSPSISESAIPRGLPSSTDLSTSISSSTDLPTSVGCADLSSFSMPTTTPTSHWDPTAQGKPQALRPQAGALAIFVLCIFLVISVVLHVFLCLRVRLDAHPQKEHSQRFRMVMQESSSDYYDN